MAGWKTGMLAAAAALAGAVEGRAQFEPPTVQRGPKLGTVTAFPAPGDYTNTTGIALHAPDGAEVHYTWDGSKPNEKSLRLERGQMLFVAGLYDGDHGLKTGYTIRAVAVQAGHTDSDPATFAYTIERRNRSAYVLEEVSPGVRMIRDSDNDKMFLVRGTKAYALIDTGMGRGALRDYVAQFTGGLPVIVILTHMHGDHIAQANQFIGGSAIYVGADDRADVLRFMTGQGVPQETLRANLRPVADRALIDLGDRALEIHAVPGHTPGSIAILDPATGNLFTGDTFGNNSPLPPDVMWLQWYPQSLDVYLANVRSARRAFGGRARRIFTGHNDRPLAGTAFLDNLVKAIQDGLDRGEAALIPSWRPPGGVQLIAGDYRTDPNWFGVNVNRATFLPAPPDRIAGLTELAVTGGTLSPRFSPAIRDYVIARSGGKPPTISAMPTSSRSRSLTIGGHAAKPGEAVRMSGASTDAVVVAPDGITRATYRIRIEPPRRGG